MKKIKLLLLLLFLFTVTGCFGNDEENKTDDKKQEENSEETSKEDSDRYESGLPKRIPLYPGMAFIEEEEEITGFQRIFIYESEDDVDTIRDWYMTELEKNSVFDDVSPGYTSDDYSVINLQLQQEYNEVLIDVSDTIQIDSRPSRNVSGSQLRILTADLE